MEQLTAIIISFCDETKFNSKKSKFIHDICGKPLIKRAAETVEESGATEIKLLSDRNYEQILKCLDEGTPYIIETGVITDKRNANTLILAGDMPLLSSETLKKLINTHINEENAVTTIGEIGDAAVYCFANKYINKEILILNDKILPEEQFANIAGRLFDNGMKIGTIESENDYELLRINDRVDLSVAETTLRKQIAVRHMKNGVTITNPDSTYIDEDVEIGEDTTILPGTIINGKTSIGVNCTIGPNSRVKDSTINDGVEINNSEITKSIIGRNTKIGPFAYLRPGSKIGKNVKIGDYVEIKNSTIGDNTKISHLSYVGDATIGDNVNVGCGVVFVNYNGKTKNKTVIGSNSFIGCNANLVAPVTVEEYSYIAAGTTVTKDVPENALAIGRSRQEIKENWVIQKGLRKE